MKAQSSAMTMQVHFMSANSQIDIEKRIKDEAEKANKEDQEGEISDSSVESKE